MKISILCPTRKRPRNIIRLCESIKATCHNLDKIEICFYIDNDDNESQELLKTFNPGFECQYIVGERIILSQMWNEVYKIATGEIFMHGGDDIIFRSENWDQMVRQIFSQFDDRIVFVYGCDQGYLLRQDFGTHGFLHKNWIDAVGYFVPPYFSSDYNDTWLNKLARIINRKIQVPMITEHMHPCFNKGEWDETHKDRLERHKKDNVKTLYESKRPERLQDAQKLQDFINNFKKTGELAQ